MEMLQEGTPQIQEGIPSLPWKCYGHTFVLDAPPLKLGARGSLFLGEKTEIPRKLNELPKATQWDH